MLSVPLVISGLKLYQALPLITTVLSISPFILISIYLYKKVDKFLGVIPLFISLIMSVEYQMLTSISRGFVTGIFFAIIGILIVYFHKNTASKFFGGLLLGFAIYANPNCLLLSPILFYTITRKEHLFYKWKIVLSGIIIGVSSIFINFLFYNNDPELVVHRSPSLSFSLDSFLTVINSLDNYFNFISPLLWRLGWISLSLFIIVGIALWRHNKRRESLIILSTLIMLLISFSFDKVIESSNSVFFSGSRMFLAYPYLILFTLLMFLKIKIKLNKTIVIRSILTISVFALILKVAFFDQFVTHALRGSANTVVEVSKVDRLKLVCEEMLEFGSKNVNLIMANSVDLKYQYLITYGCPCLIEDFPPTYQSKYDRRTWNTKKILNSTYKSLIVNESDTSLNKYLSIPEVKIIKYNKERGWILLINNLKTKSLIKEISN